MALPYMYIIYFDLPIPSHPLLSPTNSNSPPLSNKARYTFQVGNLAFFRVSAEEGERRSVGLWDAVTTHNIPLCLIFLHLPFEDSVKHCCPCIHP